MLRVGGGHKAPFELAQQGFFPHDAQHPLMVHAPSISGERMGHPSIPVARKGQHQLLDGVPQGEVLDWRCLGLAQPLVVPGPAVPPPLP